MPQLPLLTKSTGKKTVKGVFVDLSSALHAILASVRLQCYFSSAEKSIMVNCPPLLFNQLDILNLPTPNSFTLKQYVNDRALHHSCKTDAVCKLFEKAIPKVIGWCSIKDLRLVFTIRLRSATLTFLLHINTSRPRVWI